MSVFKVEAEHFGEVKVISSQKYEDERGHFSVAYRQDEFTSLGLPPLIQDNLSVSVKNVIRGLHFQPTPSMGKLMRVISGRAILYTVDFRPSSPTFLKWVGIESSEQNPVQVWAPGDFLRGICSLEDNTKVQYKCTEYFNASEDKSIYWNDPEIGVSWPVSNPIISERDKRAPTVREYLSEACEK